MKSKAGALIAASLLGGIIFFLYTTVAYMLLPFHGQSFTQFKDEAAVASVIKDNQLGHGMYVVPAWGTGGKPGGVDGLMMFAVIKPQTPKPNAGQFARGLAIYVATAFLFSALLLLTRGLSFMGRVGFVLLMTLTVFVAAPLSNWNWWEFTFGFAFLEFFDLAVGWFLGGLAISWSLRHVYGRKGLSL